MAPGTTPQTTTRMTRGMTFVGMEDWEDLNALEEEGDQAPAQDETAEAELEDHEVKDDDACVDVTLTP